TIKAELPKFSDSTVEIFHSFLRRSTQKHTENIAHTSTWAAYEYSAWDITFLTKKSACFLLQCFSEIYTRLYRNNSPLIFPLQSTVNPNPSSKKRKKIDDIVISLMAMKMPEARLCHLPLGFNTLHKPNPFRSCDASNYPIPLLINTDLIKIDEHVQSLLERLRCFKEEPQIEVEDLKNDIPCDDNDENIDPEEFGETFRTYGCDQSDDDGENEKVEKDMGREHYISVGKSTLRHNLFILDDPKYVGKHSNRKDIFDDSNDIEDIEMTFGVGSEYDNENEITAYNKEDKLYSDKRKGDEDQESDFDNKDDGASLENGSLVQEELKKIEEDERNLLHKMTQNVQEDINKGRHVKTQLGLWDTFLDTRIRLQKVVSIANSLPQNDVYSGFLEQESEIAVQETRKELRELVDSLIDLRKDLYNENENIEGISDNTINSRKRHLDDEDYAEYLWKDMKELRDQYLPYRKQTIDKWSNK
ncbi:2015_t:CDS:2, partial [Funneliformis caledonium]